MTASLQTQFAKVFAQLKDDGFLLLSDPNLPSVSGIVTGENLSGSWWSHKLAHTIFNVNELLEDHPDVMIMKLISEKVTFVHRELWDRIYSIGVAREEWQLAKLSSNATALLKVVDESGSLHSDKLGKAFGPKPGEVARELEIRLVIHAEQVHTESGKHAKVLETWPAWAKRAAFRARPKSPVAARRFLEDRLSRVNLKNNSNGKLPWPS